MNIGTKINGVIIKKIKDNRDARGWLSEIYRDDKDSISVKMCYVSHTNYGYIRGPHEHLHQTDFFIFIGYGDFELHLWDNRKNSNMYGSKIKLLVGANNKVGVIIPPGVVHGYKSISKSGSLCINLPDRLYAGVGKKEKVDEIRYEDSEDPRFLI